MASGTLFQHKMSLKAAVMLGCEHPHGRRREVSLETIGRIVETSQEIRFTSENRQQRFGWVERVLVEHEYQKQGKAAGDGSVRRRPPGAQAAHR
jgi:hypothetical protein